MSLLLEALRARAFHSGEARAANTVIAQARDRFLQIGGANGGPCEEVFSYEVLVPEAESALHGWLAETLLPRLVYHCESSRAPLPACAGVFVSAFVGETLHCVAAREVVAFACEHLGLTHEEAVARHGTGEVRHALRD